MPQSLACVYLHLVFSTKDRSPFLADRAIRGEVLAYLAGIARNLDCPPIETGGVADHVHLLVRFGRSIPISDFLRELKRSSSLFAKARVRDFAWQGGYAAFSVDPTRMPQIAAYVANQEEHHREFDFKDELRSLLREHGMEWDERYLWD